MMMIICLNLLDILSKKIIINLLILQLKLNLKIFLIINGKMTKTNVYNDNTNLYY
jgi:hypothetical protein